MATEGVVKVYFTKGELEAVIRATGGETVNRRVDKWHTDEMRVRSKILRVIGETWCPFCKRFTSGDYGKHFCTPEDGTASLDARMWGGKVNAPV